MFTTPVYSVIGTPLLATSYDRLRDDLLAASRDHCSMSIDFTNTHIVTARRHDPVFRALTSGFDAFVPDGMPLIWCMNRQGAALKDRVYGPTFTRRLAASPPEASHYFLGASEECLGRLMANLRQANPRLRIAGSRNGYFKGADEDAVLRGILDAAPDFLWVGLGTPKQQEWIARHRAELPGVIILAVGFAFDVNAGTKKDAPDWMQRLGLTWLYRVCSEPRRLLTRYVKFNSLFLGYLLLDRLRKRDRSAGD